MLDYYVYYHINPLTKDIFYVGKGTKNRAYTLSSRGKHWINYVNKYGIPEVEIVQSNLSEEQALELEKQLIKELGRKDLKEGNLINSTDGGEGTSGLVHSDITKQKIAKSRQNKPANNKGKTWKQKIDKTGIKRGKYKQRIDKGKTFDSNVKENMKEGKRNNSKIVLQFDLQNNFIKEWRSAADVVDSLGLKGIYNCLTGISNQSGGYIWKYKNK